MGGRVLAGRVGRTLAICALIIYLTNVFMVAPAGAIAKLVQTRSTTASGAASVSLAFASGPAANDLLVAICGASGTVTITAPTGLSTAISQSTSPAQAIFYKVATGSEGTTAFSCGGGTTSTRWGMQIYDYAGMATSSPLDSTPGSATGTSTTASSGSTTTTNANDVLVAGITSNNNTVLSAWTNSFVQENNMTVSGGTKMAYGGADFIASSAKSYSTAATAGNAAWHGQIAAFKESPVVLTADMVDGSGSPVASPSIAMSAATTSFICQTVTGSLGVSTQKIRINNTTATIPWTLSIAATNGSTSTWTSGTYNYKFNDATGSGCTNGQLTVNPSVGTVTPQSGCTNTGVSLGTSAAFNAGVTDSVTLASASATASLNCYWDITGISLSQKIPPVQKNGSYALNLTLTVVAN